MDVGEHKQEVGNRIRVLRLRKALTQEQLAERAGISAVPILMAEQKHQVPLPRNIRKIAEALDVPVETVTTGKGVPSAMDPAAVGKRLRTLRWNRGLSQTELSEASGACMASISQAEQGRRLPHPSTLHKLARALEVPVEEITVGRGS